MSRASVVDFPAMRASGAVRPPQGRDRRVPRRAGGAGDPCARADRLLFSAHRTGGMTEALYEIGRQTVADAELILQGLAPVTCRRAQRETVGRSRSKPVEAT